MVGISLKQRTRNEHIRGITKLKDIVEAIGKLKWNIAGHIEDVRTSDARGPYYRKDHIKENNQENDHPCVLQML